MWERAVTKMNILWGQLLANLKKDEKERDRKYKKEVMHLLRPQRFRGNNEVHNGGEGESSRNSVEERNSSEEADAGESDVEVDDGKEMQTGVRRFEFFERWPIIGRWVKLHHARVAHEELALVFEMNRAFLKAQEVLRHASGDEHHADHHGPAHAKSHESKELWNFVGAKMRASRHSTSLGLAAPSVKRNEHMERSAAFKEALLREIKKREKLEKKIAVRWDASQTRRMMTRISPHIPYLPTGEPQEDREGEPERLARRADAVHGGAAAAEAGSRGRGDAGDDGLLPLPRPPPPPPLPPPPPHLLHHSLCSTTASSPSPTRWR